MGGFRKKEQPSQTRNNDNRAAVKFHDDEDIVLMAIHKNRLKHKVKRHIKKSTHTQPTETETNGYTAMLWMCVKEGFVVRSTPKQGFFSYAYRDSNMKKVYRKQ